MKEKQKENRKKLSDVSIVLMLLLCCVVILGGSTAFIHQNNKTQERFDSIQHSSLGVLTESIDHALYMLLSRAQSNLAIISGSGSSERQALEKEFLENRESKSFETAIRRTLEVQSSIFDRILVRKDKTVLFSTLVSDPQDYRLFGESDANNYAIAQTADGSFYLAISTAPSACGLIYTGLIPVELLYSKMMVDSVNSNFWVVLYDSTGNIVIQNEDAYPYCMIMDRETALARGDGFSYLVQAENEGSAKTVEYSYDTDASGKSNPILAYCLPASLSENRAFSIGVHMDNSSVRAIARQSMTNAVLFAALLTLSGTVLIVLLISLHNRQTKTDRELEELREKKELTEKLLENQTRIAHRQRMESLGVLTAGIAHEFNNLLTPILGHSLMAIQNIEDENSPLFTSAMETYSAAQKAKTLVSRISSLTRKNLDHQLQELSVNGLVRSALELTQPSQPENVECILELNSEKMLRCNEVQMHQLLMNLIINAYHAMKETGGTLTIRTSSEENSVTIVVSDTGPGVPDEEKQRIFDPFYTTKAPGKGTGLGLPLAMSAVQSHGGTLTLSDTPGHGATFTAIFPLDFKGDAPKESTEYIEHGTR